MAPRPAGRDPSRRRVLQSATAAGAALTLAACGAPVVVERVVVVPKVVEREVIVEHRFVIERAVIVEKEVVIENEVVVTRVVTPPPTPSPTPLPTVAAPTATPESPPQPRPVGLRAAISPVLVGDVPPDLSAVGEIADVKLEILDGGGSNSERLLARAAAGDLPDLLIGIPGGLVTALDEVDALAPLDVALGAEHGFLSEMAGLGRRERGLMGMPVSGHPTYLLASRQRLEQGGVADVGATYAALGETARRLTDPETYRYGFGVVSGLPELETVASSAGPFPTGETAVAAWQWYADQWLHERISPPPSAWDGQGAAGEAVTQGRVALAIVHGRALSRLAALPPDAQTEWEPLPLPAWPERERRVPMAAAFIAARSGGDGSALEAAIALAGPARMFDGGPGTPAWTLALDDAAAKVGLDMERLLEARDAWSIPAVETADWRPHVAALDVAVQQSLTLGQPAAETAAMLETEFADSATSSR